MRNTMNYNFISLISIACSSIIHTSLGQDICTNNPYLSDNADWKCLAPKDCPMTWKILPSRRVRCGNSDQFCCPHPLPPKKDTCTNNPLLGDNAAWSCIPETICTFAPKMRKHQKISCGGGGICCPQRLSSDPKGDFEKANKIALKKCYDYAGYKYHNYTLPHGPRLIDPPRNMSIRQCPEVRTLVSNGVNALPNEFPHMALLGYDDNVTNENSWSCGGSLVSEQFILSAAHCTEDRAGNVVKWAAVGILEMKRFTSDMIGTNLYRIVERFDHPDYNKSEGDDDIALYKLEHPMELNPSRRPICIFHHEPSLISTNSEMIITGWGAVGPGTQPSEILQAASIKNLDPDLCENWYRNSILKNGFDRKKMICGGDLEKKKDTCPGDSGGPVQVRKGGEWWKCVHIQVGITSVGHAFCGQEMGAVYTRTSAYLPWIQKIVWP